MARMLDRCVPAPKFDQFERRTRMAQKAPTAAYPVRSSALLSPHFAREREAPLFKPIRFGSRVTSVPCREHRSRCGRMPTMTPLDKSLKRALKIDGRDYVITLTPDALKITRKGHRVGVEINWLNLVSGESALAVALRASIGNFQDEPQSVGHPAKAAARRPVKAKATTATTRREIGKRKLPKRRR
jgi:hypothetical protein